MVFKKLFMIIFAICILVIQYAFFQQRIPGFPKFEFDVYGIPPSQDVYKLTEERVVQKILYTVKDSSFTSTEIAERIGEKQSSVQEKLKELGQYDLVKMEKDKWITNFPLYVEEQLRIAEKVHLKYAKMEADILRMELPELKKLYSKTTLSCYFPWEKVSLVIVGGFLADFCVMDRIPFKPENFAEEKWQSFLGKEGQNKWAYTGYEILPKRYPSRKWHFYHNVRKGNLGGGARFGYFRHPDEKRKEPPSHPEGLFSLGSSWSKILFALAEGPFSIKELERHTRLSREELEKSLGELTRYVPPAIISKKGKYKSEIPILTESDLNLLLPELDRVAERIFKEVGLSHGKERREKAKELGYRWPLPADTYVRDKALQILVEEALLSRVQDSPVDWNFGVWGWKGFLQMWDEVTKDVKPPKPDLFVTTFLSDKEKKAIEEFKSMKERIFRGEKFSDTSTPVKAFLTRISEAYHSDKKSGGENYVIPLEIRRVHLPEQEPKDGDVVPIFTKGDGGIYVYFYYKGSWKPLYNLFTEDEYWWVGAEAEVILRREILRLESKEKNPPIKRE